MLKDAVGQLHRPIGSPAALREPKCLHQVYLLTFKYLQTDAGSTPVFHIPSYSFVSEGSCLIMENWKHIWAPSLTTVGCYKQTHSTCCTHPLQFTNSKSDILSPEYLILLGKLILVREMQILHESCFFFFSWRFHVLVAVLSFPCKQMYDLVYTYIYTYDL